MARPQRAHAMLRAKRIERAITRVARRGFDAQTARARHVDMHRRKLDIPFARKRAAMGEPFVGIGAQAVMNMQRDAARRTTDTHHGVEQHSQDARALSLEDVQTAR